MLCGSSVKTKNAFYHSFISRVFHITSTSCELYQSQIVINNIVKCCERLRSTKFGDEWPLRFATTFQTSHYFPIPLQQKAKRTNGPSNTCTHYRAHSHFPWHRCVRASFSRPPGPPCCSAHTTLSPPTNSGAVRTPLACACVFTAHIFFARLRRPR